MATTLEAPPGSRQVARGEGLSAADQRELSRLQTQIAEYLEREFYDINVPLVFP